MLLAAEVVPQEVVGWVMGFVVTGAISALGFFLRSAFSKVEQGLEGLGEKMDGLKESITRGDIRSAVLETRVETLGREHQELRSQLSELRRELKELSEGVMR